MIEFSHNKTSGCGDVRLFLGMNHNCLNDVKAHQHIEGVNSAVRDQEEKLKLLIKDYERTVKDIISTGLFGSWIRSCITQRERVEVKELLIKKSGGKGGQ